MYSRQCVDRFTEWFAYHLSNFDYKWSWTQWDYVLETKETTAKRMALKEVIERSIRLSYYERIAKTVPDDFVSFLPPKPAPCIKYSLTLAEAKEMDEDDTDEATWESACALWKVMQTEMRSKPTPTAESIITTLNSPQLPAHTRLDVFMHALMALGCKSFSHMLNVIEKYVAVVQQVVQAGNAAEGRQQIARAVATFWRTSPQNAVVLIDKLMTYRVLDNTAIVNWLFSERMLPLFVRAYVWEILRNTINKTIARTDTVRMDLRTAEEDLAGIKAEGNEVPASKEHKHKQIKETLDNVLKEQKAMFLILFQRFCMVLSDHLQQCDTEKREANDYWFVRTSGHLREVGRKYHAEIKPFLATLENLLFTPDVDPRITSIFHQFKTIA